MSVNLEFHGHKPESVLNVLKQRRDAGYSPGKDDDGHKVALLFEGGAMGGLVSAAAGAQLSELGFSACFDTIYGTSSGALNAAYFAANQAQIAIDIYKNETRDPEFMGLFRWPDQVNVKWLANRISEAGPMQLDLDFIANSPSDLRISTTDVETGKTRYFSSKNDSIEKIIPAATASSCTPMFVTHREIIDGREYSDGLVRDGIQSSTAYSDNHSHVVALLSNPVGRRKRANVLRALLEHLVRIRFFPEEFQTAFHARAIFYNEALDLLHNGAENFQSLVICPHKLDRKVGNLEKDLKVLEEAVKSHRHRVNAIFSEDGGGAKYRPLQPSDRYS